MSSKRKDHKGRVLKDGESQRKDLMYRYRYTDLNGKRVSIYSKDLNKLREKEKEINLCQLNGVSFSDGRMTVSELLNTYLGTKATIRETTKHGYGFVCKIVGKSNLGNKNIGDMRSIEAKTWVKTLSENGYSFNTIVLIKSTLKAAFQMAFDDEIVKRNPFNFSLSAVLKDNSEKRVALTEDEQRRWLDFVKHDILYSRYYDMYVVLLETGLRSGEICGLTFSDVDMENRRIKVDHQITKGKDYAVCVTKPKSENSERVIPLTDRAYTSLKNVMKWHSMYVKTESMLDGHVGFLFCRSNGKPHNNASIAAVTRNILARYREQNPDLHMPNVTMHVFRHTFCTNMSNAGMSIKNLQYLMGHSKAETTMDVYTHFDYHRAEEEMFSVMNTGSDPHFYDY